MASRLVDIRRTLLSKARNAALRQIARTDDRRLREWSRRRDRSVVLSSAARLVSSVLERGPIVLQGEQSLGLLMAKECVAVSHPQIDLVLRGVVELPVQEALRRRLPAGGVFWDVGADVGFFSLLGARITGPAGRVVAFEPSPEGAAAVRRHAELNGFSHVQVIEAAAGDQAGTARFVLAGESSWSHLAERGNRRDSDRELDVSLVVLDQLVEAGQIPPPDLVKIDVEGSELAVLRGMQRTLERSGPAIVCELHGTNSECIAFMEGAGYRLENLDGPEPVATAGPIHVLGVRS